MKNNEKITHNIRACLNKYFEFTSSNTTKI
jgi:hypothetical protein